MKKIKNPVQLLKIKNYTSDVQLFKKSVTKVANAFKYFKTKIDDKQANQFGFKELQYTDNKNPTNSKKYYFNNETKKIVYMPTKNPAYKKLGSFKEVIKEDSKMIAFNFILKQEWDYTINEIAKIFNKLSIKYFQPIYETDYEVFIANNRGIELEEYIFKYNKTIPLSSFKNILLDIKKLHIAGYFYRDFKPENILIDKLDKLWVIDSDGLTRKELKNKVTIGTPGYITIALLKEIYCNENYDLLKTADDYALALTLLECNSGIFRRNTKTEFEFEKSLGVKITFSIRNWIEINIKDNYKIKFMHLISNPIEYYNIFKSIDHLADMLNLKVINNNSCSPKRHKKICKIK